MTCHAPRGSRARPRAVAYLVSLPAVHGRCCGAPQMCAKTFTFKFAKNRHERLHFGKNNGAALLSEDEDEALDASIVAGNEPKRLSMLNPPQFIGYPMGTDPNMVSMMGVNPSGGSQWMMGTIPYGVSFTKTRKLLFVLGVGGRGLLLALVRLHAKPHSLYGRPTLTTDGHGCVLFARACRSRTPLT